MNTMSASPAEACRGTLVWDLPTRVFHWLLAGSFAVAWLSAESERWQLVHVTAGYTVAGLVVFRLLWGLVGTRHARFGDFVRGPGAVLAYLKSLVRERPQHHAGHNPAGALAILGLLALAALTTATGWANYYEIGGDALEEVHEFLANAMLALVIVHVAAVVLSSLLHRENLVAAMIHGRKPVAPSEGIRTPWRSIGVLLLVAVLGFWWVQWQSAPAASATGPAATHRDNDDD
ncbi:MAG: cytochrome b/b6 domain-containing protein [Burkholderiales bacterium]|nr:cytochrome b/b6 domain-containing protein [Burkholderiales bacterium]